MIKKTILYLGLYGDCEGAAKQGIDMLSLLDGQNKYDIYTYLSLHRKKLSNSYHPYTKLKSVPSINVQHCIPDNLHIPQNSETLFIPIIEQNCDIKIKHKDKLRECKKILVQCEHQKKQIMNLDIDASKICVGYIETSVQQTQDKLTLGPHDNTTKFYFRGNYYRNQKIISKLIDNFLKITKYKTDKTLTFNLSIDQNGAESVIKTYEQLKKYYGMASSIDSISFIFDSAYRDHVELHNTCDIYLALNDDYYPSSDTVAAQRYNNMVIDYSRINYSLDPHKRLYNYDISNAQIIDIFNKPQNYQQNSPQKLDLNNFI